MTIDDINASLKSFGKSLELESSPELDSSGLAQLVFADDSGEPMNIDLELDGEADRLVLYLDAGSTKTDNREYLLSLLLQQNLRSLAPNGISIGLGSDDDRAILSRSVHEAELKNDELAGIFERFVTVGIEVRAILGGGETGDSEDDDDTADGPSGDEGMMRV